MRRHASYIIGFIILSATCIFLYVSLQHRGPIADERYHVHQIDSFVSGDFKIDTSITTPPFFHFVFAGISKPLLQIFKIPKPSNINVYRGISILISLICILFIAILASKINPYYKPHTVSFWYAPITFLILPFILPYLPFVYTDIFAIIFILFAILFALEQKSFKSAFFILCATLIRQPAILWSLIPFLITIKNASAPLLQYTKKSLREVSKRVFPFILLYTLFGLFILYNNGIALGDRSHHHVTFNFDNIFLLVFIWAIVFFPDFVLGIRNFLKTLTELELSRKTRESIIGFMYVFLFTGILIFAYVSFMSHPHVYNSPQYWFYIRNMFLLTVQENQLYRLLFATIVSTGILSLLHTPLTAYVQRKYFIIFIIISFISVAALPVVEQRYYMPFFALYVCVRAWNQRTNVYFWIWNTIVLILGIFVTYGIYQNHFYL